MNGMGRWNGEFKLKGWYHIFRAWSVWTDQIVEAFGHMLHQIGLLKAIQATQYNIDHGDGVYRAMLETFLSRSNTCVVPNGELWFALHKMVDILGLLVVGDLYEEYVPTVDDIKGE
ncbi:hypothetical protein AAC387_Pa03g1416 [Persea americana]